MPASVHPSPSSRFHSFAGENQEAGALCAGSDEEEKEEKDTLEYALFGSDDEGEAAERAATATAAAAVSASVARYRGRDRGKWVSLSGAEVDGCVGLWYAVDEVD